MALDLKEELEVLVEALGEASVPFAIESSSNGKGDACRWSLAPGC
jgi:hypothetical protein